MSAVFPPLSRPARFVGTVDATRDSRRPTPRTLEQCAGMQRSHRGNVIPMDAQPRMSLGDKAVVFVSGCAFVFVIALLAHEHGIF